MPAEHWIDLSKLTREELLSFVCDHDPNEPLLYDFTNEEQEIDFSAEFFMALPRLVHEGSSKKRLEQWIWNFTATGSNFGHYLRFGRSPDADIWKKCFDAVESLVFIFYQSACSQDKQATDDNQDCPFDSSCFLLWDNMMLYGKMVPEIHNRLAALIVKQIGSDNLMVVQSGLHGLSHMHDSDKRLNAIGAWLKKYDTGYKVDARLYEKNCLNDRDAMENFAVSFDSIAKLPFGTREEMPDWLIDYARQAYMGAVQ